MRARLRITLRHALYESELKPTEGVEYDLRYPYNAVQGTSSCSKENRSLQERSKKAALIECHRSAGRKLRHVVASGSTYLNLELVHIGRLEMSVIVAL